MFDAQVPALGECVIAEGQVVIPADAVATREDIGAFECERPRVGQEDLAEIEAAGTEVTDDSFLVERLGIDVVAVSGSARNIKITTREDLVVAEALLSL